MNEEKTQLRACPFCGGNPRVAIWMQMKEKCMQATCQRCGSSSAVFHGEAHAELFAAWNRRASPSVNEEKTEAAGGVELLRRALAALDTLAGDINGFGPVDYPDEIATIEAVRRRVDGVPTCERPNLRSLWGCCKLGSGCQCTSATQQGECEHRADGVQASQPERFTDQAKPRQCWAVEMGWERKACETPCAMKKCNPAGVLVMGQHTNGDHTPMDSGTPSTPLDTGKAGSPE